VLDDLDNLLGHNLFRSSGLEITPGTLLAAVLVLFLLWIVTRTVRRAFSRYEQSHTTTSRAAIYTVARITHYLLLAVGMLVAISVAGIPVSKFTVFASAFGVGIGFGLQAVFNNFVSGLIILFERSLKVGDFVELASGIHGEVRDIRIRATRITTNDNVDVLVPNSEFVNKQVVNWTLRDASRRLHVPFGASYGTDKEVVKRAGLEAAAEVPFTACHDGARRPQVWLTGFGDQWLKFELIVWLTAEATKRPSAVTAAYNWALHSALLKHGIEIPLPQRDLNMRSWFGLEGDDAIDAVVHGRSRRAAKREEKISEPSINDAVTEVQRQIAEDASRNAARQPDEKNKPDAGHATDDIRTAAQHDPKDS
jgi:small-conductance mechanosensitive channel